jgi:colicin import membrane protein
MRDELNLPLLYSAIAHLVLVLIFTVNAALFPEALEVVEQAIRVDIVDLPEKLPAAPPSSPAEPIKEVVKPEPPASKAVEQEPEPEVISNPTKVVKAPLEDSKLNASDAIKKLKKQLAIEKIKEEMKDKERQELSQRVSQYKGTTISPGTELTGVNKLQHEAYLSGLDKHVKQYWSLPEWLARGSFSAQVRIYIDEQGLLIKSQLIRGSGNPSYDDTVLETIKKAVPYPIPPDKFRAILRVHGMVLGFPE